MAQLQTTPNEASVQEFLDSVDDETKRRDCQVLVELMGRVTGEPPKMWGPAIVGFGTYHYRYESGREGDWFVVGFSPRKQSLSLYLMSGFGDHDELLARLGKHSTGKSCLYVKRLDQIDLDVLEEMVVRSVEEVRRRYPT